jgi:hypothetical protein
MTAGHERALFSWLVHQDRLEDPARFERVVDAVLALHAVDRRSFSDVLEPSVSGGRTLRSHARFSYAFPRHSSDPRRVARELLRVAETLGPGVPGAAERVLRAARHPIVAQPLVGLAADGPRSYRAKLYLQLRAGAPSVARRLAAAVLTLDPASVPSGDLHLLGLDLNEAGLLMGAKLYYRGPPELAVERLRGLEPSRLADVLHIHRIPGVASVPPPTEVDFAVGGASIGWRPLRDAIPELAVVDAVAAACPIRVRRASFGRDGRATAYFVLS